MADTVKKTQAWFVVEETSQHDDNGNGRTFLAISIYEDDATDAIAWVGNGDATDTDWANARLIAEAGTVLHETGLTPRELANVLGVVRSTADQLAARIKTLEGERAELVNFAKMVAKSCECECAVTPHDQHQDGCMHWLQTRSNHLIAKLEGPQES